MTKEENNYSIFHAIAVLLIILIFLLKTSSSSTPGNDYNHESSIIKSNVVENSFTINN